MCIWLFPALPLTTAPRRMMTKGQCTLALTHADTAAARAGGRQPACACGLPVRSGRHGRLLRMAARLVATQQMHAGTPPQSCQPGPLRTAGPCTARAPDVICRPFCSMFCGHWSAQQRKQSHGRRQRHYLLGCQQPWVALTNRQPRSCVAAASCYSLLLLHGPPGATNTPFHSMKWVHLMTPCTCTTPHRG